MKIRKYFLLSATVLALSLFGTAIAKQPNNHGNEHSSPDARLLNSNKQSETWDSLRGRDRADERQEINPSRDHDNSHDFNKPDKQPRYKH